MRRIKICRGVISVFVALMITGILSLGTFVLEAARLQAARTQLGEAVSSAASSMLASYNADLQTRYGLLAMDTQRANEGNCNEYVQFNSDLSASAYGNNATRLYRVEDVEMTGIYNLTYPHILKRQLLTVAKYNLPPEASEFNMYNAFYVLNDLQMKCQYVSDKMAQIQNASQSGTVDQLPAQLVSALSALDMTFADVKKYDETYGIVLSQGTLSKLPSITGTVESEIPEGDALSVDAMASDAENYLGSAANVLETGTKDVQQTDVSVNMVAISELSSYHNPSWLGAITQDDVVQNIYTSSLPGQYKNLADTINAAINILKSDQDGNLLLNTYISQLFSNREYVADRDVNTGLENMPVAGEDLNFARACCEYIFGGAASEQENQETTYDYVMAIRLIGNLYAALSTSETFDVANSYSVASHMAWAYYETCVDMQLLTEHNTPVPLTKEKMVLRMDEAEGVAEAFAEHDLEKALAAMGYYNETIENYVINGVDNFDYTDSLNLSLWLVPNSTKLLRVADLIQLEMRYQQRYVDQIPVTFLMSEQNTYCRVSCSAKMNSILPVLSIGGTEHSMQGLPLSSLKYAGY